MIKFNDTFFTLLNFLKNLKTVSSRIEISRAQLKKNFQYLIYDPPQYVNGDINIFYGHDNEIATFLGYKHRPMKTTITGDGSVATVIYQNHGYTTGEYIYIESCKYFTGKHQVTVIDNNTLTFVSSYNLTESAIIYSEEIWSFKNLQQSFKDKIKIQLLNNKEKFKGFYDNTIYQHIYDSKDNQRFFNYITDWYSSIKTIAEKIKNLNDPYKMNNDELDLRFKGFGFPYYYLLKSYSKVNFLNDLINLYKIKGSPKSVMSALKYFFGLDAEIHEFWLYYDSSINDVYFKGIPSLDTNNTTIIKPYTAISKEPHWYYTKTDILNLINTNPLNLPSLTPFITVTLIANFEDTRKAYLLLSFLGRLEYQQWLNTSHIEDKRVWQSLVLNKELSLLEIILGYSILFNEYNNRFLPQNNTDKRMTYNPNNNPYDFEADYDSAFEILEIDNDKHDKSDFGQTYTVNETIKFSSIDTTYNPNITTETTMCETSSITFQQRTYVFGGVKKDGTLTNEVWSYDLYARKWQYEFSMPYALQRHHVIRYGEFFIVLGGVKDNGELNYDVLKYNILAKQWTIDYNKFNFDLIDFGLVKTKEDQVMIFGGYDIASNIESNNIYKFDLDNYTITQLTSMPNTGIVRFGYTYLKSTNQILINGGINKVTIYNNTYKYDIATDTWSIVTNSNIARMNNILLDIDNGQCIIVGGLNFPSGANLSGAIHVYDNLLQPATTYEDRIKYYIKYTNLLYLNTTAITQDEMYNYINNTVYNIDSVFSLSDIRIDSSSPYSVHNTNIVIIQPLKKVFYDSNNPSYLQFDIDDNIYIRHFIDVMTSYQLFTNNPLNTPQDNSNYSRQEEVETKLANRDTLFTLIGKNIAQDENENKTLLQQINPELYDTLMYYINTKNTDMINKILYDFLSMLDDVARFYNIESTFNIFGMTYLMEYIKQIIDFFKPIQTRYLGVGTIIIPFKDRVENTWPVDEYTRFLLRSKLYDYYEVNDLLSFAYKLNLKDIIQWSYNFDSYPNVFDIYTIYENLILKMRQYLYLEDNIQWSYNFDSSSNLFDILTIYENLVLSMKTKINLSDEIQWSYNFDNNENIFDVYTIYENLVIKEHVV